MADPARERLEALPLATRVAIAQVLEDALASLRALAVLYATFGARSTLGPLKAALAELAEAKTAHLAALEASARALNAVSPAGPTPGAGHADDVRANQRSAEFAAAFQGERALEVAYRELAALLGDHALLLPLAELVGGAARDRARLRRLYLRYS